MADLQKKKQEIVEVLARKVKEPKVAEYLYRMAGMKSTLKGKASNDLIHDTCRFLLDVIFEEKLQHLDKAKTPHADDDNDTNENFQDASDNDDESSRESNIKSFCNKHDNSKQGSPQKQTSANEWSSEGKICYFWRKGKCNKGSLCRFDHPRICGTFMKFGLNKYRNDTNGCHKNCNKLHPLICKYSLKYRTCRNDNCKFQHTTTTKIQTKEKSETKNDQIYHRQPNRVPNTQSPSEPVQNGMPFLSMDCLRLLIREAIQMELGCAAEKTSKNRECLPSMIT